jgi:hypothetical protein
VTLIESACVESSANIISYEPLVGLDSLEPVYSYVVAEIPPCPTVQSYYGLFLFMSNALRLNFNATIVGTGTCSYEQEYWSFWGLFLFSFFLLLCCSFLSFFF